MFPSRLWMLWTMLVAEWMTMVTATCITVITPSEAGIPWYIPAWGGFLVIYSAVMAQMTIGRIKDVRGK